MPHANSWKLVLADGAFVSRIITVSRPLLIKGSDSEWNLLNISPIKAETTEVDHDDPFLIKLPFCSGKI